MKTSSFVILAFVLCLSACSQKDATTSSQQWEYKIVSFSSILAKVDKADIDMVWADGDSEPYLSLRSYLDELGAEGWELVSLGQAKEWGYNPTATGEKFSPDGSLRGAPFIFKRPKTQQR